VLFGAEMGLAQNYSSEQIVLFNSQNVRSPALARFKFSDARINNGGVTAGFLQMSGFSSSGRVGDVGCQLQIHRLIFDDSSTTAPTGLTSASTGIPEWSAVPEPSSLGLLALGAGGLLARRRRAMAA
jgi:hypothetical protein